jgi:hypothetical protein
MSSNRQPEENESLLRFIASTVEMIRDRLESTATKEDIERVVTKEEFEPVREQVEFLGGQVEDVRDRMATRSDLARVEDRLGVQTTAIRGDVEQVHLRLDGIDRAWRCGSTTSSRR